MHPFPAFREPRGGGRGLGGTLTLLSGVNMFKALSCLAQSLLIESDQWPRCGASARTQLSGIWYGAPRRVPCSRDPTGVKWFYSLARPKPCRAS